MLRISPPQLVASLMLFLSLPGTGQSKDPGEILDIGRYRGSVVVLDFWASWCVPCRRSFPWMNAMQDKYGKHGLVIVGVNLDKDRELAEAFLDEIPADFHIVFDPDGTLPEQYGVVAMPSSYVLDRQGNVVGRHLGFKRGKTRDYEAMIRSALNL